VRGAFQAVLARTGHLGVNASLTARLDEVFGRLGSAPGPAGSPADDRLFDAFSARTCSGLQSPARLKSPGLGSA